MKKFHWFLLSLVVVSIGVTAWWVVSRSEDPFFAYLAERRAAGLPNSFAELEGAPPTDSENGAPALDAACKKVMKEHGPTNSWKYSAFDATFSPPEDAPWPDFLTADQTAEIARVVATFGSWSRERDAALAKPRMWMPPRFGLAGEPTDDVVLVVQNAQRIVGMQASAAADSSERLAACRALLVMGRRGDGGQLTRQMTAMMCTVTGTHCLRHAVEVGAFDPSAARASCDELLRGSFVDDLRRGMRCFAVEFIEQYRAILEGRVVPLAERRTGWDWAENQFEKLWAELRDTPRGLEPEHGMAKTIVAVCRGLDAAADADAATLTSQPETWRLAHGDALRRCRLDVVVARITRTARRIDAAARLARVGMAVAEFRVKHGDFPASLDELRAAFADGVPTDPFTGAAFVYEKTPTGVRVASAGRGADDPLIQVTTPRMLGLVWELKR